MPCGSAPTVCEARPLGDGVGPGIWGLPSLSLVQGQIPGMGSGAPLPAICKSGSTCPVPDGVDATVGDILMVNPAGVIDVFSLYTFTLTCCYKAVVWLSN